MRWQVMEMAGVALMAVALGFVHYALSIGLVGLYFVVTAVLAQLSAGRKERGDG